MAQFPEIPRRFSTIRAPQSSLSGREIAAPYAMEADAYQELGKALGDIGVDAAKEAGAQAVTKDADGNIQVQQLPLVGRQADVYQHAVQTGALAQGQNTADLKLTEIRNKFENDPEAFKAAADSFKSEFAGQMKSVAGGIVGAEIERSIDNAVTQHYRGLLNQKQNNDVRNAAVAIDARIKSAATDLVALARNGGTQTPEYKAAFNNYQGLLTQKTANPLFNYPKEAADLDRDTVATEAEGEAIVAKVQSVYEKDGASAARQFIEEQVKTLGSVKAQDSARSKANAWVRAADSATAGERSALDREYTEYKGAKSQSAEVLADFAARGRAIGNWRVANDAEKRIAATKNAADLMNRPDRLQIATQGKGDYFAALKQQESGGRNIETTIRGADGKPTSSAFGPYQFLKGTWDALIKKHPDLGLTEADRFNPEKQEIAIRRFTEDNAKALQAAGIEATGGNLYMAHFLGAGGAVQFLNAAKSRPNDAAENHVNPETAAANKPIFYNKDGSPRTVAEVYQLQTRKFGGGDVDLTQDAAGTATMKIMQKEIAGTIPNDIEYLTKAIDRQEKVDIADLEEMGAKVAALGTPQQKQDFVERQAVALFGNDYLSRPDTERAAIRDQLNAANTENAPQYIRDAADYTRRAEKKIEADYKADPRGAAYDPSTGVYGMKPLPMIDASNPQQMGAILQASVQQQAQIRAHKNMPAFSALRPEEAQSLANTLATGDAKTAATALGMMGQVLPDDIYKATMTDDALVGSIKGMINSGDPQKFEVAMQNLDILYRKDPNIVARQPYGEDTFKRLQDWQALHRYQSPEELADDLRKRQDPAYIERRKKLVDTGEAQALAMKPADIAPLFAGAGQQIEGLLAFTPPVAAYNLVQSNSGAAAPPIAPEARDAFMADFARVYGERWAVSQDKGVATQQAVERMKTKWRGSMFNNGELTLYPPEIAYAPVNGSHDWMKAPLETELEGLLGRKPGTYRLIADSITGGEINNNQPASYRIMEQNPQTGEWSPVRDNRNMPLRYRWDSEKVRGDAREEFRIKDDKAKEGSQSRLANILSAVGRSLTSGDD